MLLHTLSNTVLITKGEVHIKILFGGKITDLYYHGYITNGLKKKKKKTHKKPPQPFKVFSLPQVQHHFYLLVNWGKSTLESCNTWQIRPYLQRWCWENPKEFQTPEIPTKNLIIKWFTTVFWYYNLPKIQEWVKEKLKEPWFITISSNV